MPNTSVPALPERIGGLAAVAVNLSWSWNRNARRCSARSIRRCGVAPSTIPSSSCDGWRQSGSRPARRTRSSCGSTTSSPPRPRTTRRPPHLVRHLASRVRQAAGRVLLCRIRVARLGSHLLRGLGVLAGDQCKAAFGSGRPARRRRPVLHQGLLGPATAPRRMAGRTPRSASTWPRRRCNGCAGRRRIPASPPCGCPGAT